MKNASIYDGITPSELLHMRSCFNLRESVFESGETIFTYSENSEYIGIVEEGVAHLECIDENGNYSLLEKFEKGGVFGSMFIDALEDLEYIIVAEKECRIIFLKTAKIFQQCKNVCACHARFISNLFFASAQKAKSISLYANILRRRTVREKILSYLKYISRQKEAKSFDIPMSLAELSDYIGVDRSSMMREIAKMKSDGIIASKGRRFTLLS